MAGKMRAEHQSCRKTETNNGNERKKRLRGKRD